MAKQLKTDDTGFHATFFLAIAVFLAELGFLIWGFLQPGTLGMYRMGVRYPVIIIILAGTSPLAIALGVSLTFRKKKKPRWLIVILSVFTVLALLFLVGLALFVFSNAYGKPVEISGRINIHNPLDGLARYSRVFISSDPHVDAASSFKLERQAILSMAEREWQAGKLDLFIVLGDFVEFGMFADAWEAVLDEWQGFAPNVPFLGLMGNHDSLFGGYTRWKQAMTPRDSQGKPIKASYNFITPSLWRMDAGKIHFISLDLLWGPEGFSSGKKAWLESQLDSIPQNDYIIILNHAFIWASGYIDEDTKKPWYDHQDMIRELAPILEGRADLVVSGHNHYMEWLETSGTAWAIIGAMGGIPDPEPVYRSPYSLWHSSGRFGVLALELTGNGLECTFLDHNGIILFEKLLEK